VAAEPVAEDSVPEESVLPEPVAEDSVPEESEAPDGGMGTEPVEPTPGPADPEAEGDPRAGA